MPMLAELVDGVIGVDTHRDTLAAAVSHLGGVLAQITTSADGAGDRQLFDFARRSCLAVAAGRWKERAASAPA
jgi:transposase